MHAKWPQSLIILSNLKRGNKYYGIIHKETLWFRRNYKFIVFYNFRCRWWCHFDDDNYVHISQLILLLKRYSSSKIAYLGKPSTARPLEIFDDSAMHSVRNHEFKCVENKEFIYLNIFLYFMQFTISLTLLYHQPNALHFVIQRK